nr:MAG TPA: hypothetical protein [Caudoviricetes sp.]
MAKNLLITHKEYYLAHFDQKFHHTKLQDYLW